MTAFAAGGGVYHAVIGTLLQGLVCAIISIPIGILVAVFSVRPLLDALAVRRLFAFRAPAGLPIRGLAEAYPDAKVLLSVRDAEAWERSMRDTVWGVKFGTSLIAHLSEARGLVDPDWAAYLTGEGALMERLLWAGNGMFAGPHEDRQLLIEAFERYNENVRAQVPADRLLEWSAADGWAPICERLGVAVPDEPFPVTNTTKEFREMLGLPPLEA